MEVVRFRRILLVFGVGLGPYPGDDVANLGLALAFGHVPRSSLPMVRAATQLGPGDEAGEEALFRPVATKLVLGSRVMEDSDRLGS